MRVAHEPRSDRAIPDLAETYSPGLINAANEFSVAAYRHSRLPPRIFEAARIATAVINGCTVCRDFRLSRHLSLFDMDEGMAGEGTPPDEAFYQSVLKGDLSGLSDRERLAVRFVQQMGTNPQELAADETFWAEMKAAFDDSEIVDLTYCAANWIGLGRATHILGIDIVCRLPAAPAVAD
ncbi:carboxymuconolactone decarboxylase family protein [Sphingobium cloacae]|uniref:Carboxymuconolactone decarboxylase n=1 Tax=Sphingobium cloacae TaxID=120107 RepID=A0A1E1F786_9SPHN|nr:hypothetical protein [Sphingobium cloacae]BAV66271.1 hypothetical protein SCLO_1032310 [Sphingobium cloacae]